MKVLLTGAFGNIGESTLIALLERDHTVTCLDIETKRNRDTEKKLQSLGNFTTVWGDVRDEKLVRTATQAMDSVIHLVGLFPPKSEENPELAQAINVEGTLNIINSILDQQSKTHLIFASSVSVFGPMMHVPPPRRADEPTNPTDVYTRTKVSCEEAIKAHTIPWTILRIGACPTLSVDMAQTAIMFESPLNQRVEFVHSRDAGVAFANAVTADVKSKVLLIGGGKKCQMMAREFFGKVLDTMGIGTLPDTAFKNPSSPQDYFYTDWLDTEESQKLLQYQSRVYDDYLKELKDAVGVKRYLFRLVRGLAKRWMLAASPYYQKEKR